MISTIGQTLQAMVELHMALGTFLVEIASTFATCAVRGMLTARDQATIETLLRSAEQPYSLQASP